MSGGPGKLESLVGLLGGRDYFAALVVSALSASAMRQLGLVTVGALAERFGREEIMGASCGRAFL
jgi:hypothetical protein